jgi:hypothetical protein
MKQILPVVIVAFALAGCQSVQQSSVVTQQTGQTLVAGVGDTVLRVDQRESLPNVVGGADIFGRTRSTGATTVQYGGVRGNSVLLLRSGIVTQSDETTMSRSGMFIPTQQQTHLSGTVGTTPVSGTSTTMGSVYVPPRRATTTSFQQPTIPIEVDWKRNPRVPLGGRTIVIEDATATSLTYRIE